MSARAGAPERRGRHAAPARACLGATLCLLVALCLAAQPAAGSAGRSVVERARAGAFGASFSYTVASQRHSYTVQGKTTSFTSSVYGSFAVRLTRSGRTLLEAPLSCQGCSPGGLAAARPARSLHFATLAGAAGPVALVDLFSGGAHCCFLTTLVIPSAGGARLVRHDWGDPGYRLAPLGPGGGEVFVSADDRFAYAFTDYAASVLPLEILRLEGARLVDVTRAYPAALAADAAAQWTLYLKTRAQPGADLRGILGAWAADEALRGRWSQASRALATALARGDLNQGPNLWPLGRAYLRALNAFLDTHGYL